MIADHIQISLAEASMQQIYDEIKVRTSHSILCILHNNNEDWELLTAGTHIELCGLIEIIKRKQERLSKDLESIDEN